MVLVHILIIGQWLSEVSRHLATNFVLQKFWCLGDHSCCCKSNSRDHTKFCKEDREWDCYCCPSSGNVCIGNLCTRSL